MKQLTLITAVVTALVVVPLTGCNDNERVAQVATQAADRQAEQNKEMARVNREVAEGTKRLVVADAEVRKDAIAMQKDLQGQASEVGQQRDVLESERRQIAVQRHHESVLAPILANMGPLLVCALVLVLCSLLVYGLRVNHGDDDSMVAEVLIEELAWPEPKLLPPLTTGRATVAQSDPDQELLPAASTASPQKHGGTAPSQKRTRRKRRKSRESRRSNTHRDKRPGRNS
jgi:hypothetical protein